MRFVDFHKALKDFVVFSLADISMIDSKFHRRRLNEWQEKGYIRKIIRGYYIFSEIEITEKVLFNIANKIYNPSYISFESALSYYNFIPESIYSITSASPLITRNFNTTAGNFSYHRLKPQLFFGYEMVDYNGRRFNIASKEKALLDYFYINSRLETGEDFEQMRVNAGIVSEGIDIAKFSGYTDRFGKKKFSARIENFMEWLRHD